MVEAEASPKQFGQRPHQTGGMRSNSYLNGHQHSRRNPHRHSIDAVYHGGVFPSFPRSSPKPSLSSHAAAVYEDRLLSAAVEQRQRYSQPDGVLFPSAPETDKLVATLFYRPATGPADSTGTSSSSSSSLTGGVDRLYGSHISPLCIKTFLNVLSTLRRGQSTSEEPPVATHRCLDSPERPRVVEVTLSPAPWPRVQDLRTHEAILRFEKEWNIEVVLQRDVLWRRHPRLVVFDMDSTLIMQEVIDLLAETIKEPHDIADRVADITHRAMMGELEFDASFRERVALLKGLPASVFDDLRPTLTVTNGVRDVLRALKRLGVKTAVLSGGFLPLTSWLARELGLDYGHANEVIVGDDGRLTGEVKGVIVGKERKRDLLVQIADKEGIDLSQVVAVGDGANDVLMFSKAGLGVAWNAKPRVQREADARLNGKTMLDLLYLFGLTREEIDMLIA